MDEPINLARSVALTAAGYPIYVARTLIQLGYEPKAPDEYGGLPNIVQYINIISRQKGYLSLYTGLRFYLPAVILKQSSYDLMASVTNHKRETNTSDASEIIAICLRESALKIHSTLITYPLLTLTVSYISASFFEHEETVEFTIQSLYKGMVPKLIVEIALVWVGIISRRVTASLMDDEFGQAIVQRIPPFIVQSLLYPFNVVSTVMADNGRSKMNPGFNDWSLCYKYLQATNQLKRGSTLFFRRDYQTILGSRHSIKRYF